MKTLSRTDATIVFTNTIAALSTPSQTTINQVWQNMSGFERLPDPTGNRHSAVIHFYDDSEQIAGELLDILVKHQDTDPPVLKINVANAYELEFVEPRIESIASPGFGLVTDNRLSLVVTVSYVHTIRTTII